MMDTNDVHKFWQNRVRVIEEEGNQMCRDLRGEVERLQNRCQQLTFESAMMRGSCAYDFKAMCEQKVDSRGNVALSDIYEIVKQYGAGLVEVPETQQGLGALGQGTSREARKRDRHTMQMELDVAVRDPNNLGYLTLDPDMAQENRHRNSGDNSCGGDNLGHQRRPAMNSIAAAEEEEARRRAREDSRMRKHQQAEQEGKRQKMLQVTKHLGSVFAATASTCTTSNNSPQPPVHHQLDLEPHHHQHQTSAGDVEGGPNYVVVGSAPQQSQQSQQQQQQQLVVAGAKDELPLLDENDATVLFPGNDVNRKRPRWAAQHFGNHGVNSCGQQQQQGGGAGGDEDEEDAMPAIEREILNERPTKQLRFTYQDPY